MYQPREAGAVKEARARRNLLLLLLVVVVARGKLQVDLEDKAPTRLPVLVVVVCKGPPLLLALMRTRRPG